ncbi:L-aspartate oxidase [Brevibacterium atlanticum]|uniref:L-aspartate oxidase n=1 Tax=Brevibacterium atlanticum TaxID=2697563 RepID=UPI00142360EF|nr:L-aspartate oxidase [Brevibacterium atlanticum]
MRRVVIVGTGIAGLSAALRLSGRHDVTVVTKGHLGESNTAWAQGGIAGVIGPDDTVDAHIADTLSAGAGHCDAAAVRTLCEAGGEAITTLAEAGVVFDTDPTGSWARAMEGAHSRPRIVHAGGDATGRAISTTLTARLRTEVDAGRVRLLEHTMLIDITTDHGATASSGVPTSGATAQSGAATSGVTTEADARESDRVTGVTVLREGRLERLGAEAVVLATGGAGQVFAHTTNPAAATGDGLAAAIRAGAQVRDLEFFQFHPTALAGPGFLLSEALRGAGALLLDEHGRRFMLTVDDRAELAPRDVVALALHRTSAAQDGRPCFLDARAVPEVSARFPSITAGLAPHGLDLSTDLIPVTPAAHYFMGGVATDLDGRTTIDGLFAVGEVACTGVHGANRLASNSLLEGAVFAARAAAAIDALPDASVPTSTGPTSSGGDLAVDSSTSVHRNVHRDHTPLFSPIDTVHQSALTRTQLQALTWDNLGVERTAEGLRTLLDRLGARAANPTREDLSREDLPQGNRPSGDLAHESLVEAYETANLALIAEHMARHALGREDSLGAHTRTDSLSGADGSRPGTDGPRAAQPDTAHPTNTLHPTNSVPTHPALQEAAAC